MTHLEARLEEVYATFLAYFAPNNHCRRAGAVAAFTGPASPLTTVKGLHPSATVEDLAAIETFLFERGVERVVIEAPPWFPEKLLLNRGYQPGDQEHVLYRATPAANPAPRAVSLPDPAVWSAVQTAAFETTLDDLWPVLHALPGSINLGIQEGGAWLAAAQLVPFGDVALFACDGTIPQARGRGYQTILIQARLHHAATAGFPHATAEVAPNGGSLRNYLRAGFEILYTRTHYCRHR